MTALGHHPGHHWAWLSAPANWSFTINEAPVSMRGAFGGPWDEGPEDRSRWF